MITVFALVLAISGSPATTMVDNYTTVESCNKAGKAAVANAEEVKVGFTCVPVNYDEDVDY